VRTFIASSLDFKNVVVPARRDPQTRQLSSAKRLRTAAATSRQRSFAFSVMLSLSALLGLILAPRCAISADPAPGTLTALAPFVDDQTVMIARFDLAQFDIPLTVKQWLTPFATTDEQRNILTAVVEQFDGWSKRLKADGLNKIYVVTTIGQLPNLLRIHARSQDTVARLIANSTFAVVPGAGSAVIEEFHKTLQDKAKQTWSGVDPKQWPDCRQIHGAAVIGMGTLLDQLDSVKPMARPEFETAMAAAGGKPLCFAVVPPPIFARAAEEILREPVAGTKPPVDYPMPDLSTSWTNKPGPSIELKLPSGHVLAEGFRWLAVGEEPNLEKFNLQVVIQSASPEAAQALAAAIKNAAAAYVQQLGPNSATAVAAVGAAQLFSLLPQAEGDQLLLTIDTTQANLLRGVAQITSTGISAVAVQHESLNHLKAIALGMLNFEDVQHHYPDRAIRDKDGKPLLSWRVAILPDIEEAELYKQFHLDEPWDSEHNIKLLDRMPQAYRSPDTASQHPGRTRYLAPVGENTIFPPNGTVLMKDITDGISKTILVIEADPEHAVQWTKPDDLEVDLDNPRRGVFNGKLPTCAAWADGSARTIRNDVDPKVLQRLFQRNDGFNIDEGSY